MTGSLDGVPYTAKGMSIVKFRRWSLKTYYSRDYYSEGDIMAALSSAAKSTPDLAVMVAADKDIAYQKVIDVTSRLRQAGVARVGLAVR